MKNQPVAPELPQRAGHTRLKKSLLIWGGSAVLALLLVFGVRYLIWSAHHETTDDAYLAGHLHPISARITDTVQQVLIDDNQHVVEGQTLVILDPNDYKVRLDQAKAALDAAAGRPRPPKLRSAPHRNPPPRRPHKRKARLETPKHRSRHRRPPSLLLKLECREQKPSCKRRTQRCNAKKPTCTDTKISTRKSRSRSKLSITSAQATRSQWPDRPLPRNRYKQAQAQLIAAQQGVVRAEAQLTKSEGGLQSAQATRLETRVREGQFATAQAAVAQATAALEDAKLQLSYTIIKAPVSGRVGRKSVEAGQRVQIGQPLMAIVEDQPWVVANFKETQLEKMRAGQHVEVEIDTFSEAQISMDTWTASLQAPAMNSHCCLRTMPPATSRKLCSAFRSRSCSTRIACAAMRTCSRPACRPSLLWPRSKRRHPMATTTMNPAIAAKHLTSEASDRVPLKTWICVIGVLIGCFLAVLNIVVTNSSLRDIAGTLAASSDEISWVPTSYLVAEIVVIPLTGWLSAAFSLKKYLLVNSILFVLLFYLLRTGTFSGSDDPLSRRCRASQAAYLFLSLSSSSSRIFRHRSNRSAWPCSPSRQPSLLP